MSAAKLAVLEGFGFNRISMGVQSFRPAVLRRENRGYQTYETAARAVGLILGRGRFILTWTCSWACAATIGDRSCHPRRAPRP